MNTPPSLGVVVLLGGPGAGKGTQARLLASRFGVPHISSGELLRATERVMTSPARSPWTYMDRGDLVPDDLVVDLVLARLDAPDARRGAVLDGFPRNVFQARILDARLAERGNAVRAAIYIDVPTEKLAGRLAGRRLAASSVEARLDDDAAAARHRIEVYLREMQPLLEYYDSRGRLRRVDGTTSPKEVHSAILQALDSSPPAAGKERSDSFSSHGPSAQPLS